MVSLSYDLCNEITGFSIAPMNLRVGFDQFFWG